MSPLLIARLFHNTDQQEILLSVISFKDLIISRYHNAIRLEKRAGPRTRRSWSAPATPWAELAFQVWEGMLSLSIAEAVRY